MLTKVKLQNFGPLPPLDWKGLGNINLIIGANGRGKTFLLKAIYAAVRSVEMYKRGNEQRHAAEILADKLTWTFQPDSLGDLVKKGEKSLEYSMNLDNKEFLYSFGKDTTKKINSLENHTETRKENSIFFPAKEVLSLYNIILRSREEDRLFGFDDTYFDLAKALQIQPTKGKNFLGFSQSRKKLEEIIQGKITFKEGKGWVFVANKQEFSIGLAAEGVKKISILDTLLGNRYLNEKSILFFDEPESALHPAAISNLMEIVQVLAGQGIQFFMASHSYFTIKKLHLLAKQHQLSIPVLAIGEGGVTYDNLNNGMPDNSIIQESIRLYEEEVDMEMGK